MMFWVRLGRYNGIKCVLSMYYSTNAAAPNPHSNFLVEMLVNSAGFSKEKAISASSKVKRLKTNNDKPLLVIDFLKQIGLDKTNIKTLVCSSPNLLFCDVDKTLKPKVKVLQEELGLSGSDLAKVLSKSGAFLHTSLDYSIRPNLDYLRKMLLGCNDSLTKVIRSDPHILRYNAPRLMSPNIAFLRNLGFSSKDIQKFILHRPMLLLRKNSEWFEKAVHQVENDLQIPRHSSMFIYGIIAIGKLGESPLEMKLEIFRRFGWSDLEILKLVRRLPLCLSLSEAKLGNALNFFMKELGYGVDVLASRPILLTCSLEKRVLPRYELLKLLDQKNLAKGSRNLCSAVQMSEPKFLKSYVLPFKDEMPELYELYMKTRR